MTSSRGSATERQRSYSKSVTCANDTFPGPSTKLLETHYTHYNDETLLR